MIKRLLLALAVSFTAVVAQIPIPATPTTRVTDKTGTLSQVTITNLNQQLEALEKKNSSQILVYMDYTLNNMPIEDFGIKAARLWKPGQAKDNSGAILLIFKNDRKMRIEVGRGLEVSLTDTRARSILDDIIRPKLKAGDFNAGVTEGAEAMIKIASGESFQTPVEHKTGLFKIIGWALLIFIILTIVLAVGSSCWFRRRSNSTHSDMRRKS